MTEPRSILVARLSALGDIVLSLPTVEALRARFPAAHLAFLARDPEGRILRRVRAIDRLVLWSGGLAPLPEEVRTVPWDLLVDLSSTGRSRRLLAGIRAARTLRAHKETLRRFAFVRLRALGGANVAISSAIDRMTAALWPLGIARGGRMPHLGDGAQAGGVSDAAVPTGPETRSPRVLLAPGGGRAAKQWPRERFAAVTRSLVERGMHVVIVGSREEEPLLREVAHGAGDSGNGRIEIVAGADPAELPRIAASCDVALTNDSGLLHVAEACGVPVVAIFGPTHPRLGFAPWRKESIVLRVDIDCSPCDLHGPERCPLGHHRCMVDLSIDTVLGAVLDRLPAQAPAVQGRP